MPDKTDNATDQLEPLSFSDQLARTELNVSETTVNFHRKNLRAKFGLTNQKTNLRSYLLSIS